MNILNICIHLYEMVSQDSTNFANIGLHVFKTAPKIEYKNFCFNKLHILFKWGKCVTNFIWPN